MRINYEMALKELLKHEGGYANHPRDPGGRTNLGVTQRVYEEWVGHPVTERIMRNLTPAHVKTLYKVKYWDAVRGDELPSGLDLCVFDFSVNSGPKRAARFLQGMVGVTQDGMIGPRTLSALKQHIKSDGNVATIASYQDKRLAFLKSLPHWDAFGRGWSRRVNEVEQAALRLASG